MGIKRCRDVMEKTGGAIGLLREAGIKKRRVRAKPLEVQIDECISLDITDKWCEYFVAEPMPPTKLTRSFSLSSQAVMVGRDSLLIAGSLALRYKTKREGDAFFDLDSLDYKVTPSTLSKVRHPPVADDAVEAAEGERKREMEAEREAII